MIIKGLGIVSWIELAFFAMFIALLVWSFSTYLRVSFAKITPQSAAKNSEQVYEYILFTVFFFNFSSYFHVVINYLQISSYPFPILIPHLEE